MIMDVVKLGKKIREERKRLFLKQGDISGDEFSKGYISLIEKGKINPSLKALNFIANKLNKPLVYFLDDNYKEKNELINEITIYKKIFELLLKGKRSIDNGNYDDAINIYKDILNFKLDKYSYNIINFYLGRLYVTTKYYKDALMIFNECLPYFSDNAFYDIIVEIYYYLGFCTGNIQDFTTSLSNYLRALEEYEKNGIANTELKCRILFSIANLYNKMGELIKARDYYIKCLETSTSSKSTDFIAKSNNGLGLVSLRLKEYKDALKYIRKSLILSKALNLKSDIANEYNYMGFVYTDLKKFDIAKKYFSYSYAIYKDLNNKKGMAYNLTEIGRIYFYNNEYDKALEYLYSSLKIANEINEEEETGRIYTLLGSTHLKLNDLNKSKIELTESIKILNKLGLKRDLSEAYKAMGDLCISLGETKSASLNFNKSIELLCDYYK